MPEIYIRIDMDGFSLSHERDQRVPDEYRFVEIDRSEGISDPPNIEVWTSIKQEQNL